jgi:hypothetical protein
MHENQIRIKIFRSCLIKIDIMVPERNARKLANISVAAIKAAAINTATINKRGFIASYSSGHCGAHVTIV